VQYIVTKLANIDFSYNRLQLSMPAEASVDKCIQGGPKSKLLILSEYVNKTEKIGVMRTNTNIYREILYVTIVLCLNIL